MPSHVPTFSAALRSSRAAHAAVDGQKKPTRNGMTKTRTIHRTGAKSKRGYTPERISPHETSRIARGRPSMIGSAICAVINKLITNPSGNQRSAQMPCAATMTPDNKQKRMAMTACTSIFNHTAPCAVKCAGVLAGEPSRQTQQARVKRNPKRSH